MVHGLSGRHTWSREHMRWKSPGPFVHELTTKSRAQHPPFSLVRDLGLILLAYQFGARMLTLRTFRLVFLPMCLLTISGTVVRLVAFRALLELVRRKIWTAGAIGISTLLFRLLHGNFHTLFFFIRRRHLVVLVVGSVGVFFSLVVWHGAPSSNSSASFLTILLPTIRKYPE